MPQLHFERTIPLWHSGTCRLLGISPAPHSIYAEEVYGEGNWIAQYGFHRDGTLIGVADEAHGENPQIEALALPDSLKVPSTGWVSMTLNLGGAPTQGSIDQERIRQIARGLKTPEKEMLIARGWLPEVPLNEILGIIGSYVMAEAQITRGLYWIIRQLRVAVMAGDNEYTTYEFPVLHRYTPSEPNQSLHHSVLDESELGVMITRPADLVMRDDLLVIADAGAGDAGRVSTLHLWQIELDPPTDEDFYGSVGR